MVWKTVLITLGATFLVLGVAIDSYEQFTTRNASAKPECHRPEINKDNILVLINEHRLASRLEQLPYSEVAAKFAQARADEIAMTGNYQHDSALGTFFDWQLANIEPEKQVSAEYWSEVLMRGAPDACATVDAWKTSPTHNDALLRDENYTIGIGVNGNVVTGQLIRLPQR